MASSSQAIPTTTTTTTQKDMAEYIPLYRAILEGEWENAQKIIDEDESALTAKLDHNGTRALHFVVSIVDNIHLTFLENFLKKIDPKSLPTLVDDSGQTALHSAVVAGNTEAAKMLVKNHPRLLYIANKKNELPIVMALYCRYKTTLINMLEASRQNIGLSQQYGLHSPFEGIHGVQLLNWVILVGFFDVALELIKDYPNLARTVEETLDRSPLWSIASKSDTYYSGTQYNFFQRLVYSYVPIENYDSLSRTEKVQDVESQTNQGTGKFDTTCLFGFIQRLYVKLWKIALQVPQMKSIQKDKMKHNEAVKLLRCICKEVRKLNCDKGYKRHYVQATYWAAINGTHEAIKEIVESFPQAAWCTNNDYYLIQLAIMNRSLNVYNLLIHPISSKDFQNFIDKDGNNLMHLAGHLAPVHRLDVVSGAALQMQRELLWFQELENFVFSWYKEEKNNKGETPIMVFRKEHRELKKEGEEWMKKAADSYTIVAALIITIVFAAAITVPGGTNQETGRAVFTKNIGFIIFAVSDAISLFTSTTSLLLFLSILTARYAYEDFRYSLPKRLIFGLTTLFMSVTSMMVAFSATLYLMFGQGKAWILIPIAALTCLPIASFVTLQFPLLVDLISSTYGRIFRKQSDRRIY